MKYICLLLMVTSAVIAKDRVEGVLMIDYGDSFDDSQHYQQLYLQTLDEKIYLNSSQAFKERMPIHQWTGKQVSVLLKADKSSADGSRYIQTIELLEGDSLRGGSISGSQKWISLLCKFSDKNAEPENLSYFQNMYANSPAGLDHYWRELSYNQVNVVGSIAVDWVDLPSTHATYIPTPGSGTSSSILNLLFEDCTEAADSLVDFSDGYVGINMMFNDLLNCCAWGGGRNATLDGQSQSWQVTWNPPWAFANEGVIAHEMGHGMGLPHANNSDGDSNPYDSPWDVMSSATGYGVQDSVYGRLGKHINMEFKHNLGWVDDSDGFITDENVANQVILINYTALPNASGYRFAKIPASNGTHFVVEVRKQVGNYESNIAGNAVIIHHVSRCRSEPPWVVDQDNPPADYSDNEGVMWKTGEVFVDPIDDFSVEIMGEFNSGFNVKLSASQDLIARQSFEATCY